MEQCEIKEEDLWEEMNSLHRTNAECEMDNKCKKENAVCQMKGGSQVLLEPTIFL